MQLINFHFYSEINWTTVLQSSYSNTNVPKNWLLLCFYLVYPAPNKHNVIERSKNKITSVLCRDNKKKVHWHFNQWSSSLTQGWNRAVDKAKSGTLLTCCYAHLKINTALWLLWVVSNLPCSVTSRIKSSKSDSYARVLFRAFQLIYL